MAETQARPGVGIEEQTGRNWLAIAVVSGHALKHLYRFLSAALDMRLVVRFES